jgi:hypothetical protein
MYDCMHVIYNVVYDVLGQALFKDIVWQKKKKKMFFSSFWEHFIPKCLK